MRKLASIQEILEIKPIDGADKIELAIINGWQVVVQKGVHEVGDMVVYFEIDSFIPVKEQYKLPDSIKKTIPSLGEGYRIRTIKLRGEISQGFIMPIRECEELKPLLEVTGFEEGFDVTDILGVKKYEQPVPTQLRGTMRGNFPWFVPKTDQERVQNLVKKFDGTGDKLLIEDDYEVTLKLDGSSCTVYFNDGQVGVCSRNIDLKLDEENDVNAFIRVTKEKDLLTKVEMASKSVGCNLAFQGELMGEGIQGNREDIVGLDFFLFDIFNITEQRYLSPRERRSICNKFDIKHTPVLFNSFLLIAEDRDNPSKELLDKLLEMADTSSIKHKIAEGLVFKSNTDSDFSFKIINTKFLLKCEE